nr:hypothetical protein [uncultured Carboxylicivirga sp.]
MELELKNKTYYLPESWDDLTPDQFLFLLDLLNEYTSGKREARSVGINFAMYILGVKKPRLMTMQQSNQYYENLGFVGESIAFWWKVVYSNADLLNNIDPKLKKLAENVLPEDMPDSPEVRVLQRATKYLEPNFSFSTNLIPQIKAGYSKYFGYRFGLDDDLLSTTLTAGQFSDAMTISGEYAVTKKEELLNHLCAMLYYKRGGDEYSFEASHRNAADFKKVSVHIKQAVCINFIGVCDYLTLKTKYSILFRRSDNNTNPPAISIGFNNNLYSLSKSGYGDAERLMKFNVIILFDLMLKELIDAVNNMKQMDMELDKILSNIGLTIEQYKLIAS